METVHLERSKLPVWLHSYKKLSVLRSRANFSALNMEYGSDERTSHKVEEVEVTLPAATSGTESNKPQREVNTQRSVNAALTGSGARSTGLSPDVPGGPRGD